MPQLYVANFHAGTVEVYDGNFAPVTLAKGCVPADASIPSGFAPFNIVNINNTLYVAYAKQDAEGMDDVAGPGNGYVDIFDMSGNLTKQLVAAGRAFEFAVQGMAIAPANFGDLPRTACCWWVISATAASTCTIRRRGLRWARWIAPSWLGDLDSGDCGRCRWATARAEAIPTRGVFQRGSGRRSPWPGGRSLLAGRLHC